MSQGFSQLPEFCESSIAAVRLLQGVVYSDDASTWDITLVHQSELAEYFIRIGLVLVIDENDGLAYLRQLTDAEREGRYEDLPKLFRRTSLGFDASLLAVLLRDELRRFEDEDLENERCIVELESLFDNWKSFFSSLDDEVKLRKRLAVALGKLEKLKFVKRFHQDSEGWEIKKLLKARLPIDQLQQLRDQLVAASESGTHENDNPNLEIVLE